MIRRLFKLNINITAPFNNMQTLKFQAQLRFTFYAAVNHNYDDKQQKLTKWNEIHQSKLDLLTILCKASLFPCLRGSEKRNCWLSFELHSSRVIEKRSNEI